jgi:hypothetical protein
MIISSKEKTENQKKILKLAQENKKEHRVKDSFGRLENRLSYPTIINRTTQNSETRPFHWVASN